MEQQELISMAFKMTVSLGIVLMVFAGAIFIVRKFSNSPFKMFKKQAKTNHKPLEVMAFQSLGPGRGLYLLRCLDQKILIGATNASIQHLADIVEQEDDLLDDSSDSKSSFSGSLKSTQSQSVKSFDKGLKEIARV
jgi:flagellar biogenesis protein FliO